MSVDDDEPTPPRLRIVEKPRHPTPVTMEILNRRLEEHSEADQKALGAIAVELAEVRKEQATKRDTTKQTGWIAALLALVEIIHRFL